MDLKINFHATKDLVLFNYKSIDKPVEEVMGSLEKLGFKAIRPGRSILPVPFNPVQANILLAMNLQAALLLSGQYQYRRGAKPSEAPLCMDCSSMVQYFYRGIGVEIPRLSIEQSEISKEVSVSEAQFGDLIFKSGKKDRFENDPGAGIGHVGIVVESNGLSVIHMTPSEGLCLAPLSRFTEDVRRFRGIRRIVPRLSEWVVLGIPEDLREVITHTNSVKWRVLTSLE
ncbi:MAG: NLP/P60 protein [Parcubacteria group bacterium Gr01-1014_3]|nr:MAG: NLP/P60 protein [Parcubacteria group bacterium Gr01-1014_3]